MYQSTRRFLVADFETSTQEWYKIDGYARVWLWGIYDIEIDKFEYGIDIDSFMKRVLIKDKGGNPIIYFHNLKFDGSYIVNWLFRNGYEYDEGLSDVKSFKTAISDTGQWYFIEICIYRKGKQKYLIRFQDSLKKISLPVRDIPKAFGFSKTDAKGELDYATYRPLGHLPTEVELAYLKPDVVIVAKALKQLEDEGFTKMTESSDAFYHWKLTLQSDTARAKHIKPEHDYRELFPVIPLEIDDYIRKAYKGGWTYVNPKHAGKIIMDKVEVWDINSMYPSKMKFRYLPMGTPVFFKGTPHPTKYQCYITRIMVSFEIKKGFLPTIQVKNSYYFNPTEYIDSSDGNEIELYMTNIDLKLLFKHYTVKTIKYLDGYYFYKIKGVFDKHIDTNMEIKENSEGGKRYLAKKRMNTVYGKTATSPRKKSKTPYLDEGVLRFTLSEEKEEEPQYTAEGVFITAWARHDIITDAQNNYDKFIYCDTDSLHMFANNDGSQPNLPIHETQLGFYKKEHTVIQSLFLRSKTYIEEYEPELNQETQEWESAVEIKCAGASPIVKQKMNFANFEVGKSFEGKLMPRQVEGGVILFQTTFTIK